MKNLTHTKTFVQFSQYGEVKQFWVWANKLQAMNIIKNAYGIKSLSVLEETQSKNAMIEGTVWTI